MSVRLKRKEVRGGRDGEGEMLTTQQPRTSGQNVQLFGSIFARVGSQVSCDL